MGRKSKIVFTNINVHDSICGIDRSLIGGQKNMVNMNPLDQMLAGMRKNDTRDLNGKVKKGGDGILNINFPEIKGPWDPHSIDKANPELGRAIRTVNETFGLSKDQYSVAHDILHYFDRLDGKEDGLIKLDILEKFVKNIADKGNEKDKFIKYLKDRITSCRGQAKYAPVRHALSNKCFDFRLTKFELWEMEFGYGKVLSALE